MYCPNCGIELTEGAKFCLNCGTKVESNDISENIELVELENSEYDEDSICKKVNIFGNEFNVTYDMFAESNIKGIIRELQETTTAIMINFYFNAGSMQNVAKDLRDHGCYQLINTTKVLNTRLIELIQMKRISIEAFGSQIYDFIGEWEDRVDDILSLYHSLLNERNEFLDEIERKYRADVPNPNANLYMQDYYKNQYNSYIKEYNKAFKMAYELPETIEKLKNAVNEIVYKIGNGFMEILEAQGILTLNIYNPEEIISELSCIPSIDNKCEVMYSLLQKSPDNPIILNYAFIYDIGDKKEILEYCDLMDIELKPTKKVAEVEKLIMNTDYSNYLDISKCIDEVSYICSKYMIEEENYINFLKDRLNIAAESATVYDGILYSTLEEGLEARKALDELMNEISMISDDDREKMYACIEKLKDAPVDSNEKYITYLEEAIAKANENAKIVEGCAFDSEEEAIRNKDNMKYIYDRLNEIPEDSIDYLKDCKSFAETNIDERLTNDIINRINLFIGIVEKCDEMAKKYKNYVFATRYEYTVAMVEMEVYYRALELCKLHHKNFCEVYEVRLRDFKNVFGTITKDTNDAIKEYVNCVKHAMSYKKSLDESQAPKKKGLFGNLKATVKGLWNSQYELEYNRVTLNGQRPLPNETEESLGSMNKMYGESGRRFFDIQSQENRFVVKNPYSCEKKYLNAKDLFILNKNSPNEFPIKEISEVLTGSVIEIRTISNSNFEQRDVVYNHISNIDRYQFITIGKRYIPEWFKDTKKHYCAIYTDITTVRESMSYLKEKKITCNVYKYRIQ